MSFGGGGQRSRRLNRMQQKKKQNIIVMFFLVTGSLFHVEAQTGSKNGGRKTSSGTKFALKWPVP